MSYPNTRGPFGWTTATDSSSSEDKRRNRFNRLALASEPSNSHAEALPCGRVEAFYMQPPSRSWPVSPPRCAAEMPRVNPNYEDHRDVSPLGSPIVTHMQYRQHQSSGHGVGKNDLPFRAGVTDATSRAISAPTTPRRTYTRPDELQFPESPASEVPGSHERHVVDLLNRGANVVRAAVAFEQPVLRRQNALRKPSVSVQSPRLRFAQEVNTKEARLGLVRTGQQ
ncbi:hypothetical protein DPSP01_006214 [Paraphaeosphaeria sporulosa]|uniref:Uncharacterized protein n=1 Tax=Paraphaeosphaeria sporulosa TaxID=1460663 RepID=A0A177BX02_9PLEO|nr:uncharacterized protein CC84DRAFT_1222281 [Paraphaeosphaeria sporulosa]OAF99942.1 hypothetical protein CC84DRAFT_1222281 [Paraphaeosphaeria sporulosa]